MPADPNRALAENLRALRTRLNLSQEECADRCGLHRTYIGAIERGHGNVTLKTLAVIAHALKVSPAELIVERQHAA
jgi:transcriptional regulator with XRE-family HTH domain